MAVNKLVRAADYARRNFAASHPSLKPSERIWLISERGLFFLMVGLLSGAVCFLLYLPAKRKRKAVSAEEEKEDDHAE